MASTETKIPKAVLYYSPKSVWSAVALLALNEKGYGADEIDLHIVDLASGENYNPTFLRLNPKATVPTLVVPLENTLSSDVESRYKAITDSKTIVEFLDKSRSVQSRTNTTSGAPAPTLAPATIAFMTTSNEIIELLHSEAADPNKLWLLNARDQDQLRNISVEVLPFLKGKEKALLQFLKEAEGGEVQVSEKTKKFWQDKREGLQVFLNVFSLADETDAQLSDEVKTRREVYFATARTAWESDLKQVLEKLERIIIGPYALGDQFSIADLHLAAWLTRMVKLVGGTASDNGETVARKLSERSGQGDMKRIGVYWDVVKERQSWKKEYGDGVF